MVLGALLGPALSAAGPLLGLGGTNATTTGGAASVTPTPAGNATTGPINVTVSFNNVGNPYINVSADGDASGTGTGTGTGGAATSTSTSTSKAAAAVKSEGKSAPSTPPTTSKKSKGPTTSTSKQPATTSSNTGTGTSAGTSPDPGPDTDPSKIALITEADFKDFSTQYLIPLVQQVNTLRNQVTTLQDQVKTLNEKVAASESRTSRAVTYRTRTDGKDWSQEITHDTPTMLISEQVNFTGPVMLTYTAHVKGPTNIFIVLDDESCDPHTARAFNCTQHNYNTWTPLTATVIIRGVHGKHQVRVKAQKILPILFGKTHVNGSYLCVQHL